jgi:hypothetical protein
VVCHAETTEVVTTGPMSPEAAHPWQWHGTPDPCHESKERTHKKWHFQSLVFEFSLKYGAEKIT